MINLKTIINPKSHFFYNSISQHSENSPFKDKDFQLNYIFLHSQLNISHQNNIQYDENEIDSIIKIIDTHYSKNKDLHSKNLNFRKKNSSKREKLPVSYLKNCNPDSKCSSVYECKYNKFLRLFVIEYEKITNRQSNLYDLITYCNNTLIKKSNQSISFNASIEEIFFEKDKPLTRDKKKSSFAYIHKTTTSKVRLVDNQESSNSYKKRTSYALKTVVTYKNEKEDKNDTLLMSKRYKNEEDFYFDYDDRKCITCNWEFPFEFSLKEMNIHINNCLDQQEESRFNGCNISNMNLLNKKQNNICDASVNKDKYDIIDIRSDASYD